VAQHQLLPSQKNDVFEVIQRANFPPSEFEWRQEVGDAFLGVIPKLVHRPSGFWFAFDFDQTYASHVARFSPGDQAPVEAYGASSWPFQLSKVRDWLDYLGREYHAPDLWGELNRQRELTDAASDAGGEDDNRPFSVEEQAAIATQLHEIKELLLRTEQFDDAGQRALEARFDYLEEASSRLGRRDWLSIFYGTVFSWGLSGLISPDTVKQTIVLALHGLGHLFGAPPPQLGP